MTEAEPLRQKAHRLLDEYGALGAEPTFAEARTAYEQLLAEGPDDPELQVEFGYLQVGRGRNFIRDANKCFERAIELAPDLDQALYQLIMARASLLDHGDVIERYKERLSASPDDIRSYRFLARAYLYTGALTEASKVVEAGRKLEPDDDALLDIEADRLEASGERKTSLALRQRLKERDPDNMSPWYMSAFTLEGLGRYAEAAAQWRHIIAWLDGHDMSVHSSWPKEMLASVEAKLTATNGDNGPDGAPRAPKP